MEGGVDSVVVDRDRSGPEFVVRKAFQAGSVPTHAHNPANRAKSSR